MKKLSIDSGVHVPKRADLLVISGEPSGDQHAAKMIEKLKIAHPQMTIFTYGGGMSQKAGAKLLYNLADRAVMGFYEVIGRLPFFWKLLKKMVMWIQKHRPKTICLVDCPGLNLRLAELLYQKKLSKKAGGDIEVVYYIPPQVWAWKRNRVHAMEKYIDRVAVIFPFEKHFFKETSLPVTFVGHPFLREDYTNPITFDQDGPILLLPGSREKPIKVIFPLLLKSFREILKKMPHKMAIVVYPHPEKLVLLRKILNRKFSDLTSNVTFIPDGEPVVASAAMMSSGTMSLKCCLAGVPGAIVYKTSWMSYCLGRMFVSSPFIGIGNVLLSRGVWKEFIQGRFRPKSVAKYILQCRADYMVQLFHQAADELKQLLSSCVESSVEDWVMTGQKDRM